MVGEPHLGIVEMKYNAVSNDEIEFMRNRLEAGIQDALLRGYKISSNVWITEIYCCPIMALWILENNPKELSTPSRPELEEIFPNDKCGWKFESFIAGLNNYHPTPASPWEAYYEYLKLGWDLRTKYKPTILSEIQLASLQKEVRNKKKQK